MGHFSVSCCISKLDIRSGRCGLIPLIQSSNSILNKGTIDPIPLGIDGNVFMYYSPLSLPIWGEYDEYGRMENIEETELTKALERRFSKPIQNIVDDILDGKMYIPYTKMEIQHKNGTKYTDDERVDPDDYKFKDVEGLEKVTCCWINKNVYRNLSDFQTEQYCGLAPKSEKLLDLGVKTLKELGFKIKKTYKENDDGDLEYLLVHENHSKLEIKSSENFSTIFYDGEEYKHGVYSPLGLKEFLQEKGESLDMSTIQNRTKHEVMYDGMINSLNMDAIKEILSVYSSMDKNSKKAIDIKKQLNEVIFNKFSIHYYMSPSLPLFNPIKELYIDLIICNSEQLRNEYTNWQGVFTALQYGNIPLFPSPSGVQDGEHGSKLRLASVILGEIKNQIKNSYSSGEKEEMNKELSDFNKILNNYLK